MVKAYLKNSVITLHTANGREASFVVGSAVTSITENRGAQSPYALFTGANLSAVAKQAGQELDRLYAMQDLSPDQVLCAMDEGRKNKLYTGRAFSVSLETVNGEAVFAVSLKDASDLLAFEIICAVHSKKPLKKCENCGGYFFPAGRSDAIYCDRIGSDGFSCKKIGAHRQYRKNSRTDSVKALYDKTTKHNRYLKSRGLISERDYDRWMQTVSELYGRFKNGEIVERTLITRLEEELTVSSRSNRREISDYLL